LGLKKGAFPPQSDLDVAWVIKYARSEESAGLKGIDVFKFLVELSQNIQGEPLKGESISLEAILRAI
jgi:hypothetical protein